MFASRFTRRALAALALTLSPVAALHAAEPIRLVVGFAPGGGVDTLARVTAQHDQARRPGEHPAPDLLDPFGHRQQGTLRPIRPVSTAWPSCQHWRARLPSSSRSNGAEAGRQTQRNCMTKSGGGHVESHFTSN